MRATTQLSSFWGYVNVNRGGREFLALSQRYLPFRFGVGMTCCISSPRYHRLLSSVRGRASPSGWSRGTTSTRRDPSPPSAASSRRARTSWSWKERNSTGKSGIGLERYVCVAQGHQGGGGFGGRFGQDSRIALERTLIYTCLKLTSNWRSLPRFFGETEDAAISYSGLLLRSTEV